MSEYDTAPSKPDFERRPADHPHTDPGDGRQECDRCGKFVWPAIHSCKGVPVTDAARARWEAAHAGSRPVTAPNPDTARYVATINGAADILRAYLDREAPDVSRLLFNADVEGMAMALDAAGRLLPPDADTRTPPELARLLVELSGMQRRITGALSDMAAALAILAPAVEVMEGRLHELAAAGAGPWVPVPTPKES